MSRSIWSRISPSPLGRLERRLARIVPLWPLTALSLGLDVLLRTERIRGAGAYLWYVGTCVFSLAVWTFGFDLSARLRRRKRRAADVLVGALCFVAALLTVLSLGFHAEFHSWPTTYALVHAVNEPRESLGYVLGPLLGLPLLGVVLLWASYAALWLARLRGPQRAAPKSRLTVAAVTTLGMLIGYGYVHRFAPFMLPDATAAKVVLDTVVNQVAGGVRGRLLAATRPKLPQLSPRGRPPLIIFVVGESLPASHMSVYGYGHDTTPALRKWTEDADSRAAVFVHAMANSSVTKVSLPSLMTGLFPSRATYDLHTYPLVWNYAKAAGYRTALVSAQSYAWNNLEGFFLDGALDHVFTLETSKNPIVNSTGMDDALMLDEVIRVLERAKADDQPLFLVMQFNGTHHPGHYHPEHRRFEPDSHPLWNRDNAIYCMDYELARLRQALERLGLADQTFLLLASDHGELDQVHKIHRTESYYQLTLGVPLVVMAPKYWRQERAAALSTLANNRALRVSLVDVTPTLVDAMGVYDDAALERWLKKMNGHSLLRAFDHDRPIVAVNTDEHLRWSRQGFAVVRGNTKLLYYSWSGPALFDLDADPEERDNLWSDPGRDSDRAGLLRVVEQDPTLRGIFRAP
ncbi:MAG: LTA synthase family protein [Polyangiaceae bacterium]